MTERIEAIENILANLTEDELLEIHNQHEEGGDDEILPMGMFDEICYGMSPTDIAQKIFYGDFNPNHNYFKFDGYANFESSDFPSDWIYICDIARYMFDMEESYGLSEVEELFEQWEEEDNEEEEEEEE